MRALVGTESPRIMRGRGSTAYGIWHMAYGARLDMERWSARGPWHVGDAANDRHSPLAERPGGVLPRRRLGQHQRLVGRRVSVAS